MRAVHDLPGHLLALRAVSASTVEANAPRFVVKSFMCADCKQPAVWTADEQEFYAHKGFQNPPRRCSSCREARRRQRDSGR